MSKKAKWGTQEFTDRLFKYYMQQCDLIEELYQFQFNTQKKNKNQRVESLYLLLYSMHDTASSIGMLSINQKINESYMLARALVEKIINYVYLLFCDEEDYKRYLLYTKQKGYRNLKKDIKVGELIAELKWSGDFNLNNDTELKRAVELFTSEKKGKPITRWRNLKIDEMLGSIANKSGLSIKMLMLAMLAIYDDASEALHGTLYGTIFYIALLLSADSDLVPPIKAIKQVFPQKRIVVALPPRRESAELRGAAHACLRIGRANFANSVFPDRIRKADGFILQRPLTWR